KARFSSELSSKRLRLQKKTKKASNSRSMPPPWHPSNTDISTVPDCALTARKYRSCLPLRLVPNFPDATNQALGLKPRTLGKTEYKQDKVALGASCIF